MFDLLKVIIFLHVKIKILNILFIHLEVGCSFLQLNLLRHFLSYPKIH